jgi:hypothetical protein
LPPGRLRDPYRYIELRGKEEILVEPQDSLREYGSLAPLGISEKIAWLNADC